MKAIFGTAWLLSASFFLGYALYQVLPSWPPTSVEITILQVERGYVVPPYEYINAKRRKYTDI